MTSIWRHPGVPPLLWVTFTGFTGYAVLLPVAPLWAVHGGAEVGGSGLVNGVMLACTVGTQLLVPSALRRWGWGPVLIAGMVLLGVPALLHVVSDDFAAVLGLSAVRGVGFGVLTVIGSSAVAALVATERRGEAIGAYGLAVALPNVVLLPLGPWVAEEVGFWVVFVVAAMPVLGIPAGLRVASVLHVQAPDLLHPEPSGEAGTGSALATYRPMLRAVLLLLSVTLAGGAIITFVPQMVSSGVLATAGLLVMGLVTTLTRWRVGRLADRYGAQPFLWPLVLLTAVGTALVGWAATDPDQPGAAVFLVGMAVAGLGYGALQNLTLVLAFAAAARRHHNAASAVWNIGFDTGTALGSVAVGLAAAAWSFTGAFYAVAVLVVSALPLAVLRPGRPVER